MKRSLVAVAALFAAAALGALGAAALAGGDEPRDIVIDATRDLGELALEPAEAPAGALRASKEQKLEFFQTPEPLEIQPLTEEAATLPCPKDYKAINGYFVSRNIGIFLDLNAPEIAAPVPGEGATSTPSKRNWVIGVFNSSETEPDLIIFGVACLNKVK
ncbi:MAG: hypothetical protein ACR2OC_09670 [Solirubrobacterales bacterium]